MIKASQKFFSSRTNTKPVRLGATNTKPQIVPVKAEQPDAVSIIDKKWNEKPMSVIKSPHKLSEAELYNTL
jgi:hypothetical protein